MKKDSKQSEKDSFGLVAIASTGAILAVMIMSIVSKTDKISGSADVNLEGTKGIIGPFLHAIPHLAYEIFLALTPIVLIFIILQKIIKKNMMKE